MIKINRFKHNTIKIYNPDNSILCEDVDEFTLGDIQCQIAKNKLIGYSYEWNGQKGIIDDKGQLSDWFYGMFDLTQLMYSKLFHIRTNKEFHLQKDIDKYLK